MDLLRPRAVPPVDCQLASLPLTDDLLSWGMHVVSAMHTEIGHMYVHDWYGASLLAPTCEWTAILLLSIRLWESCKAAGVGARTALAVNLVICDMTILDAQWQNEKS